VFWGVGGFGKLWIKLVNRCARFARFCYFGVFWLVFVRGVFCVNLVSAFAELE